MTFLIKTQIGNKIDFKMTEGETSKSKIKNFRLTRQEIKIFHTNNVASIPIKITNSKVVTKRTTGLDKIRTFKIKVSIKTSNTTNKIISSSSNHNNSVELKIKIRYSKVNILKYRIKIYLFKLIIGE